MRDRVANGCLLLILRILVVVLRGLVIVAESDVVPGFPSVKLLIVTFPLDKAVLFV